MVENRPWRVIPQQTDETVRTLPPGTAIVDVFDQMNQRMLILGEPGAGKTTVLLELARELIKRADETPALPSPVVFNLSSWIQRKAPLAEWLVDELGIRYSIPKKMAQAWIEHDKLLLLLDGLDEVQSEHRDDCVEAINQFLQDHLVPLAVCSRVTEYEGLSVRLKLHGAVLLQPLTAEQIDAYLNRAGPTLSVVRTALQQDMELGELAKSPLMLSIMALAYQGVSPAELALSNTTPTRRQHLFDAYIQRMFVRREVEPIYSPQQTIRWLHWLSARLVQYGQTVFLIERMQPSWLQSMEKPTRDPSLLLLAGPIYGLGVALIFGLLLGFIGGPAAGVIGALLGGLIFGLAVRLSDGLSGRFKNINPLQQSGTLRSTLKSSLFATLFWGLFGWLISGLLGALVFGVIGGLIGGLIEIEPIKYFSRSRPRFKVRLYFGLAYGLIIGLCFGLIDNLTSVLLLGGISVLLFFALIPNLSWLIVGSIGGLIFALIFQPSKGTEVPIHMETRIPESRN